MTASLPPVVRRNSGTGSWAGTSGWPTRARSSRSRRWRARPTASTRACSPTSCARDLVPEVWVPDLEERANRERLRRRSHLVRLRTSAINRSFGLLTQGGCGATSPRCASPTRSPSSPSTACPRCGVSRSRRCWLSFDELDRQLDVLERELRPVARADERVKLLVTIPGIGELLGLTIAAEIGDIARFPSARKLVGYSGLTPTIKQSGQSSRTGRLSKAGPDTLRWAAVEAAQQAWRPTNPRAPPLHRHQDPPRQEQPRQGRRRAHGPDRRLARPRPTGALQAEPRRRSGARGVSRTDPAPASSSIRLAHRGPQTI